MQLNITINLDNAAFGDSPGLEAGRILSELAAQMEDGNTLAGSGCREPLMDYNGNRVGEAKIVGR